MTLEEHIATWLDRVEHPYGQVVGITAVYVEADEPMPQIAYLSEGNNVPSGIHSTPDGLRIDFGFAGAMQREPYRIFRLIVTAKNFKDAVDVSVDLRRAARSEKGIVAITAPYDLVSEDAEPFYQRVLFVLARPLPSDWTVPL